MSGLSLFVFVPGVRHEVVVKPSNDSPEFLRRVLKDVIAHIVERLANSKHESDCVIPILVILNLIAYYTEMCAEFIIDLIETDWASDYV